MDENELLDLLAEGIKEATVTSILLAAVMSMKYSEDQPRDEGGRWTSNGAEDQDVAPEGRARGEGEHLDQPGDFRHQVRDSYFSRNGRYTMKPNTSGTQWRSVGGALSDDELFGKLVRDLERAFKEAKSPLKIVASNRPGNEKNWLGCYSYLYETVTIKNLTQADIVGQAKPFGEQRVTGDECKTVEGRREVIAIHAAAHHLYSTVLDYKDKLAVDKFYKDFGKKEPATMYARVSSDEWFAETFTVMSKQYGAFKDYSPKTASFMVRTMKKYKIWSE
jgi:hypothetical protein